MRAPTTWRRHWYFILPALVLSSAAGYLFARDRYGPINQNESQCLLCNRKRIERWHGDRKVRDYVKTDAISDWIDTSFSPDHDHLWLVANVIWRADWFDGYCISCGGYGAESGIYYRREVLGNDQAKMLVAEWQELVRQHAHDRESKASRSALRQFERRIFELPITNQ